jgi:agmatine/peptidylarginine deiminase
MTARLVGTLVACCVVAPTILRGSALESETVALEASDVRGLFDEAHISPFTLLADFEPQSALVLSGSELGEYLPELLADIVDAVAETVPLIMLFRENEGTEVPATWYQLGRQAHADVHALSLAHDTMWIRDYGPATGCTPDGVPVILDYAYAAVDRDQDDALPPRLAALLDLPVVSLPFDVDGGNLITNGRGLLVSTAKLLQDNEWMGLPDDLLARLLITTFSAQDWVFLEPLLGESTGHVDMFLTFPTPTTVVLGSYDPEDDPENAERLDRNARRLEGLTAADTSLRVVRIPMPPHEDGWWRSYTNVIFANGVLLVPSYADLDPAGLETALTTYRQILPGWDVVPIDVEPMTALGGALHCISAGIRFTGCRGLP